MSLCDDCGFKISATGGDQYASDYIAKLDKENAELKLAVCEMFERDASAGCAFYGDEDWINVYKKLGKMAGVEV